MNTVKMYKILEQNGFSKENAEGFVAELNTPNENMATKSDIADLKMGLKDLELRLFKKYDLNSFIVGAVVFAGTLANYYLKK